MRPKACRRCSGGVSPEAASTGGEISVHYGDGYPVAQIFAPPGEEYLCIEPMTAPTNALRGPDDGLEWVPPGRSRSASFAITCSIEG